MKTLIVALKCDFVNNFNNLPVSFNTELGNEPVRIVYHNDPRLSVEGLVVKKNFDFLITCDTPSVVSNIKFIDYLSPHEYVVIPRHPKNLQAYKIAQACKEITPKNFLPVASWFTTVESSQGCKFGAIPHGEYILKATDGARGIGQIKIDVSKVSLEALIGTINKTPSEELANVLKEKFPSLTYPTDGEFHAGEGAQLLRQYVYLQEFIPNVKDEYRLLVSPDGGILVCPRIRLGGDFPQATGCMDNINVNNLVPINLLPDFTDKQLDTLLPELLTAIGFSFGSVDLFTTTDGKWGIFEYCNQFGTSAFTPQQMQDFHTGVVRYWLEGFLTKSNVKL